MQWRGAEARSPAADLELLAEQVAGERAWVNGMGGLLRVGWDIK